MNKEELIRLVACKSEASQKSVAAILDTFFAVVKNEVAGGDTVQVRGFGKFHPVHRKERTRWDIGHSCPVNVPEHFAPGFQPSDEFKTLLKR